MVKQTWYKVTKHQNNGIKTTGSMKPFNKEAKVSQANSGTKILCYDNTILDVESFK